MSNNSMETTASRREFLRATARGLALAGLVTAATTLFLRKRVNLSAAGCAPHRFCADCARLRFCQLPPAPAARLALNLPQP